MGLAASLTAPIVPHTGVVHVRRLLPLLVAGPLVLAGCSSASPVRVAEATPEVAVLVPEVVATAPHDPTAFTQGLEIRDGQLYEGTGRLGRSRATRTDLATGQVQASVDLPADQFGEGLTLAGDRLWQLTWKSGVAIRRDPQTLAQTGTAAYDGEGWGLCAQPERLVMSNGSAILTFRDRTTFAATGTVEVTLDGEPVDMLNELECTDDGQVLANVWQTDQIVRIDPATGHVTAVVDAAGLLDRTTAPDADVLNGIAAVPGTDELLLTGKLWPTVFTVRLVPR